jgi:hypothetical protein
LGIQTLKAAQEKLDKVSSNGFQALTVERFQQPLRGAIPANLRAFLPDTVEVNVDESGKIERITDRFNNQGFTLEVKIKHQRALIKRYNRIVKLVKKDLRSRDEITKLSALIVAIMMETGIRPGKAGNGVIRGKGDEAEFIETFGAITLGPQHIDFVRDNFAQLKFVGKMTTVNLASVSDPDIIGILRDYVARAVSSGSPYIFVTRKGEQYGYKHLQAYFGKHFKGMKPTDFRKLKASETVFDAIQREQSNLYARVRKFAHLEGDALAKRVAEEVAVTVDLAIEQAKVALSHEKEVTTRKQYIDPNVLLHFLSTGTMEQTFQQAVLTGASSLTFDPKRFVAVALAAQ